MDTGSWFYPSSSIGIYPEVLYIRYRDGSILVVATKLSNQLLKRVGKRLLAARNAQEMTQETLAKAVNMDRSYVAGVERGEFNVSLLTLAKIARALGVRLKALVGDD